MKVVGVKSDIYWDKYLIGFEIEFFFIIVVNKIKYEKDISFEIGVFV